MNHRLRGIIHVHSTFSYDGKHSLEEIAAMARKRGYDFVGITEHSDTLDDDKMTAMVGECRRVSRYFSLDGRHLPAGGRLWGMGRMRRLYEPRLRIRESAVIPACSSPESRSKTCKY